MSFPSKPKAHIPHTDSSGDSLTNTAEDLYLRLAAELSGRMIENVSLDTFMDTFLKSSYDERLAPEYQSLRDSLVPPSNNSQAKILPWLKSTFNKIGATSASTSPITERKKPNEEATQSEVHDWFVSADDKMPNATDNSRKMDFGMRTKGPDHMPHDTNTPDFGTVEVVAEHTAQQNIGQQKWIQLAGYARFALHNQIDRAFIFGLLIHQWDCYLSIFLPSCVIVASPFQLYDLVMVMRVVTALNAVGPIGRGRDVRFTRIWTESSGDTLQKPAEIRTGYRLEFTPSNIVPFKLQVIRHLHRRFALLGRRTHVVLCRVTSIPGEDLAPSFCLKEGDHAVIKISAIDTSSITTEAQLYDELIESGAWAVPLVAYSECGGGNKDTKDILGPLWEEIAGDENLALKKEDSNPSHPQRIVLSIVNEDTWYLQQGLETYTVGEQKVRLPHRDLSPSNILVSVSKGDKIYLDNKMFVFARENTRWAQQEHDSVFAGLFDLERTNLVGLTGHTAYLAPSVDLNWGSYRHYQQDVTSLFLSFAWMLCKPSLDKDATDEFEVDKPPSSSRYRLRSASLIPAGTGYIPHARTQKTIKRTKPHPLNGWANPHLKKLKRNDCSNMAGVLHDSVNESYRVLVGEKLYDLFDGVSREKFSWRPDTKLETRLYRSGEEYDEAAHDEYLSLMNDRAPCLVTESMQILLDLAKEATSNNPRE